MICPNCGFESSGKFCVSCGSKLNPAGGQQTDTGFRIPSASEPFGIGFTSPDGGEKASQQGLAQTSLNPVCRGGENFFIPREDPAPAEAYSDPYPTQQASDQPVYSAQSQTAPSPAAPGYDAAPVPPPAAQAYGGAAAPPAPSPAYGGTAAPPYYGAPANTPPYYGAPAGTPPGYNAPAGAPPVYGAPVYGVPVYGIPVPAYGVPVNPPVYQPENRAADRGERPRRGFAAIHKMGCSPTFLIAAVCYSIFMVLFAIVCIQTMSRLSHPERYLDGKGFLLYFITANITADAVSFAEDLFKTVVLIVNLSLGVLILFALLTAAGMWITFGTTVNRSNNHMTGAGLTMIKVVTIIRLVLFCCFAGWILFAIFLIESVQDYLKDIIFYDLNLLKLIKSEDLENLNLIFLVAGTVITTVVMVLGSLYLSALIRTVNTMRFTLQSGVPDRSVSCFAAVMNFIIAVGLLYCMVKAFQADAVLAGLAMLCLAIALCTFGVFIFQYREEMRRARLTGEELE